MSKKTSTICDNCSHDLEFHYSTECQYLVGYATPCGCDQNLQVILPISNTYREQANKNRARTDEILNEIDKKAKALQLTNTVSRIEDGETCTCNESEYCSLHGRDINEEFISPYELRSSNTKRIPQRITLERAQELAMIFAKHLHIHPDKALDVIKNESKFEVIED